MGWLSHRLPFNFVAARDNVAATDTGFSTGTARGARPGRGAVPLAGLLVVALLLIFPSFPSAHASYPAATLLGFTFTFDGKDYNAARDESTWHYTVTGPMVGGPTYKDLSHWILALCAPHVVVEASGAWERRTTPDPHHGLIGIKWDDEVSKTGSRSFYFVLKGDWDIDMTVAIGAKAGSDTASGVLPGPSCQPDACRIDYDITTRSDWRFMKPGTYAAVMMQLDLHGDSDVRLSFRDFANPEYLNPWVSAPPVHFEYSVGVTIDDADAYGWLPASNFNSEEVTVPKAVVSQGARLNVWGRVTVTDHTLSSDYHGGGRIIISPLCN